MKFDLRKSTQSRALVMPAGKGWVLWSFPGGTEAGAPESAAVESPAQAPAGATILLPARQIVTVSLWLQTTDEALFSDLVDAQLDRRGIAHDRSVAWTRRTLAQEEGRTLITAFLVNPELPGDFLAVDAGEYDLAARALPLAADSFTLWREQEGIAAACTRGGELAHLQFFPYAGRIDDIAVELGNLVSYLKWERIAPDGVKPVLWGDFTEADGVRLKEIFGVEAKREPLPSPRFPSPPLALLPAPVRDQRLGRGRQVGRRRLFLAAAAVYLVLLLAVGGGLGWLKWQERQLAAQVAATTPEVEHLSQSAARWRALAPATDPSYYPLECLLASVQALPAEVRLTEFDHGPSKVLFMGEGKDAASIFKFIQGMQADPFLKRWKWTMPQPQLLPNNRAQFQIEGAREPTPAN